MTLCIELHAFPKHLRSSSMYSDALCIRLHMLHNSALPPASMPPHMLPLLVCLFVCLFTFVTSAHVVCHYPGVLQGLHRHLLRRGLCSPPPSQSMGPCHRAPP